MTFSSYGLTSYEVQYWDGTAWLTVPNGSVTGNNKVWRKFIFSPIVTNKIRVLTHASGDGYSRVAELEAWTGGSSAQIQWLVTDQLGTPRMIFDQSGAFVTTKRHDYLPFGEELFANAGSRTTTQGYTAAGYNPADKARQKFTGYESDVETGLNFAQARYNSSAQGRFTSADSIAGSMGNPQSLNRYAYVNNNPANLSDPSGHMPTIHLNPKPWDDGGYEGGGYSWDDPNSPQAVFDRSGYLPQQAVSTQLNDLPLAQAQGAAGGGLLHEAIHCSPGGGTEGKGGTQTAHINLAEASFFNLAQAAPKILILVGDPGLGEHNQGQNFVRVAETKRAELADQGYDVVVKRASGLDDVNRELTSNGMLDGVEYIGHASFDSLFVGEQHLPGTNIDRSNVNDLSNEKLSSNAYIKLNACYSGGGGWTASIAGLMANHMRRTVWAFNGPTKFYGSPNAVRGSGDLYPPKTGGLYLLEDAGTRLVGYHP
jgi:RHS repeat-associated protein